MTGSTPSTHGIAVTDLTKFTSTADMEAEARIQANGWTAPRVTPQHVANVIAGETFTMMPSETTMVCELTLVNGFTVRGETSCVSASNFDMEEAKRRSREDAVNKVWPLEAYLLKQRLHERATGADTVFDQTERIARVCHEVNTAYCAALGDYSHPSWENAPDWLKTSIRKGVELHLNNPDASPSASHESWLKEKADTGWSYGPVKDAVAKTHPCFLPFNQLPVDQQAKDFIFRAVVHALS